MSTNNEQVVQVKPVNEEIEDWLKTVGFAIENGVATRTIPGRKMNMIINGQKSQQSEPDRIIKITYTGEGSISGAEGEICKIYGYEFEENGDSIGPTEYVDSLEQFQSIF